MNKDYYDKYSKYRRFDEDDSYGTRSSYNYSSYQPRRACDNDYYESRPRRKKKKSHAGAAAAVLIMIAAVLVFACLYLYVPSVKEAVKNAYTDVLGYFGIVLDDDYSLDFDIFPDGLEDFLPKAEDSGLVDSGEAESVADSGITGEGYSVDAGMYPYYSFLNSPEKALYRQICANVESYETTFVPESGISSDELDAAVMAVFCDRPDFFWLDNSYSYLYTEDGEIVQITLVFNGLINDIETAGAAFDAAADSIINAAAAYSDDYDKEVSAHDALLNICTYDEGAAYNQSAYSALVTGRSVCAGYARSMQYLLQRLGIPAYYCVGTAEGDDHAWNIVELADGYYNVDATWDDTVYEAYDYAYAFFNQPDAVFGETHERAEISASLPSCSATLYYTPSEYSVVAP